MRPPSTINNFPLNRDGNRAANYNAVQSSPGSNKGMQFEEDKNNAIRKVGRLLTESLSKGKTRRFKIFGSPLDRLPLNNEAVPKIIHTLCVFIEENGMAENELFIEDKKYNKMAERYKISLERWGDLELDDCTHVKLASSLLRIFLTDLPSPLINTSVSNQLIALYNKHNNKLVDNFNEEIADILMSLPKTNARVLYKITRLLHLYTLTNKQFPTKYLYKIPEIFSILFFRDVMDGHSVIVARLIHNFNQIFSQRVIEKMFKSHVEMMNECHYLKKDYECLHHGFLGPLDHKINKKHSRLNREERFDSFGKKVVSKIRQTETEVDRRVNNHEELYIRSRSEKGGGGNESHNAKTAKNNGHLNEIRSLRFNYESISNNQVSDIQVAPAPFIMTSDNDHEETRNAERFTEFKVYETDTKRKRRYNQKKYWMDDESCDLKVIEYPIDENSSNYVDGVTSPITYEKENDSVEIQSPLFASPSSSSPSFELLTTQDTLLSPSIDSYYKLAVGCAEPVTQEPPPFTPSVTSNTFRDKSIVPRLTALGNPHKISKDPVKQLYSDMARKRHHTPKHIQWLKKKMKECEDESEEEGKHRIMYDYDDEYMSAVSFMNSSRRKSLKNMEMDETTNEEVSRIIEKELQNIRIKSNRPEQLEMMSREQLIEEQLALQRIFSKIEGKFRYANTRDNDSYKYLCYRWRAAKRLIARMTVAMESTELATISENEPMEFVKSDTKQTTKLACKRETCPSTQSNIEQDSPRFDSIQSLSLCELMVEYKVAKDEKRRLKTVLKMCEEKTENCNLENDECVHTVRAQYKIAKAKSKILEAFILKMK